MKKFNTGTKKMLTYTIRYAILMWQRNRSFFYAKKSVQFTKNLLIYTNSAEVKTMRTRVTLECTECKQRNYNTTKDKKTHPDRMETQKYCKFCKKHTLHKETK